MPDSVFRPLRVFLCHASEDKPSIRKLYNLLAVEMWIEPWMDEENLLPGQDFDLEIYKATRDADAIIVCLSKVSVTKEGYVNKEIRQALDIAQEKAEGAIYVIPLRLDDCAPSFERLKQLHWLDYFKPNAHEKLLKSLQARAIALNIEKQDIRDNALPNIKPFISTADNLDLYRLIEIRPLENARVSYPYRIGKYPVTNAQYERFLNASDFASPFHWLEFPKFNVDCEPIGDWGKQGFAWLEEELRKANSSILWPRYWEDISFGILNPFHPVVGISWFEASAYCEWLFQNWDNATESAANTSLKPKGIRLSLQTEWVIAAGGDEPEGRYPWDSAGEQTSSFKEFLRHANVSSDIGAGHTVAVNSYPLGRSPYSVMDMGGNVWEWQANYGNMSEGKLELRGGSWNDHNNLARVSAYNNSRPTDRSNKIGFRIVVLPLSW